MSAPDTPSPELAGHAVRGALLTLSLANVPLRASCRDARQRHALERLLRRLFVVGGARNGVGVDLDLSRSGAPPAVTERVYASDALTIHRTSAGFVLDSADSWLEAEVAHGRGRGSLETGFWRLDPYTQREFLLLALLMMLRRHGRYGLHANALVLRGRGALLAGASGSGKTTLALGLMHQGWSLLSDDAVTLRSARDGVEAFALRRGISCTDQTERFFPKLKEGPVTYHARDKRVRDDRALFPSPPAPCCRPSLVVFPRVEGRTRSVLEALSPVETLVELARQSAGILSDTALSSRQLDVVKRLTEQAAGFRLALGRDAVTDPGRVSELLAAATGAPDG